MAQSESFLFLASHLHYLNRYPTGYDPTNPTYYTNCADPTTYNNCTSADDRWSDNVASNSLDCPLKPFFSTKFNENGTYPEVEVRSPPAIYLCPCPIIDLYFSYDQTFSIFSWGICLHSHWNHVV